MWTTAVIATLLFSISAASPVTLARSVTTFCLPATDSAAKVFLSRMKSYGASTAPVFVEARDTLHIAAVPVGQIVAVTTEASCSRAARALDSVHVGATGSALYLVALGTHFMAMRPATNYMIHLDNLFTVKTRIAEQ